MNNSIFHKEERKYFTETARAAAAEARRKKREIAKYPDALHVFVSRCANNEKRFVFELRQYGGVVIYRSNNNFANFKEAQEAGKQYLKSQET